MSVDEEEEEKGKRKRKLCLKFFFFFFFFFFLNYVFVFWFFFFFFFFFFLLRNVLRTGRSCTWPASRGGAGGPQRQRKRLRERPSEAVKRQEKNPNPMWEVLSKRESVRESTRLSQGDSGATASAKTTRAAQKRQEKAAVEDGEGRSGRRPMMERKAASGEGGLQYATAWCREGNSNCRRGQGGAARSRKQQRGRGRRRGREKGRQSKKQQRETARSNRCGGGGGGGRIVVRCEGETSAKGRRGRRIMTA